MLIVFYVLICVSFVSINIPTNNTNTIIPNTNIELIEGKQTGSFTKQMANLDCYFYVPTKARKNMPLVIFLHGVGEHNIGQVMKLKPVQSITDGTLGEVQDFIFVAPAAPKGSNWAVSKNWNKVIDLIEEVTAEYGIDTSRIYLTGFSAGGNAVWGMVNKYPHMFRAAIPVSGSYNIDPAHFTGIPIYAIVGEYEIDFKNAMRKLVNSINKSGGNAIIQTIPKAYHKDTQQKYTTKELYNWLLNQ